RSPAKARHSFRSEGVLGCDRDHSLRTCSVDLGWIDRFPRRFKRAHLLLARAWGRLTVLLDPGALEQVDLEVRLTLLLSVVGVLGGRLRGHCFRVGWTAGGQVCRRAQIAF
ncbi:hypothetical protein L916_04359, partial [Phytophthora nicotianae]